MGIFMRKIALLMDGWKRFFTYAWPAGILQRLQETEEAVNLYIFHSAGNWSKDREYNEGEYNIYRLPDLKDFDGIILDLCNVVSRSIRDEVVKRAVETGVPVLSIANELEGCSYVGIDNYAAMEQIIRHLHQEHDCKSFWFIMGEQHNYECVKRVQALEEYMRVRNIPFSQEDFFFESFAYQCGEHGFEQLLSIHGRLPDAIICANDNIAVGVCEAADKMGYHAPEDFRITGFDNFDKAGHYKPSISTVEHIREEVGYCCADILLRAWKGESLPKACYTSVRHIFQESCGCSNIRTAEEDRFYLKNQIVYEVETDEFAEDVLLLEYELMKCGTVEEMMTCIPQTIPALKCDAIYLVLDRHIDYYKEHTEHGIKHQWREDEGFHIKGYPACMEVRFAYENGRVIDAGKWNAENIFPLFDYARGGRDFLFIPIHFRNQTVGYLTIRNAVYLMEKQYLFQVVNVLTTAIENLHKKERLAHMNKTLSKLYIMDSMTGMYNRLGFQQLAENFLKKRRGTSILIMFVDVDGLKEINDNYGHEYGDFAIITTAKAILKYCDAEAVPARMGGDEFVLIQEAGTEQKRSELVENIRRELVKVSGQMQLPKGVEVSMGISVTDPDSRKTLKEYVKEADENMYQEKQLHKKA